MKTAHWIFVVFVSTCLGLLSGFIISRHSAADLKQKLQKQLEQESYRIVNEAQNKADKIVEEAKREAEGFVLRQKAELFKLYPNLKEYRRGSSVVNQKYIRSFRVQDNKIKIEMHNATQDDIGPNANIIFLNKEGFITKNYTLLWVFSRIKPGETRFDEGDIEFKYGEPVYYSIEFGN